ncbi:MAG TPA: hypothetical protein VIH57_07930 [Bacteroidales bacterium]
MSAISVNQNMGVNMDSLCMAYIVNRMRELGFKEFHFEPYMVILSEDNPSFEIYGQNEHYYLTSVDLCVGTEISADNNQFRVEDYYSHMGVGKLQEFTGFVNLSQPKGCGVQVIEFLRVVPKYSK